MREQQSSSSAVAALEGEDECSGPATALAGQASEVRGFSVPSELLQKRTLWEPMGCIVKPFMRTFELKQLLLGFIVNLQTLAVAECDRHSQLDCF